MNGKKMKGKTKSKGGGLEGNEELQEGALV
jgi:hypothetical protein